MKALKSMALAVLLIISPTSLSWAGVQPYSKHSFEVLGSVDIVDVEFLDNSVNELEIWVKIQTRDACEEQVVKYYVKKDLSYKYQISKFISPTAICSSIGTTGPLFHYLRLGLIKDPKNFLPKVKINGQEYIPSK